MKVKPQGFIPYRMEHWDIALCVSSGQAFRWRQVNGAWIGVDADRVMWLRPHSDGAEYATFPQPRREEWVRRYFQLDTDLSSIHQALIERDPEISPLIARFAGLRVLRWGDPEECLLSFLCTVNNNIPRISGMIERLAKQLGRPLALEVHAFPSAKVIAAAREEDLRALGFGYRARSVGMAAQALCEKRHHWLSSLVRLGYQEAWRELQSLPGVGPKVADCTCLFALGFSGAVPVDTHLWQAMCEKYFPEWQGLGLTQRRYETVQRFFAERFGELAGWAHQYLFYDRMSRRQRLGRV